MEENRKFQRQRQREAWSGQGQDEQSLQQLRSNSDLSLQLTRVKARTCCLYSFVKYLSHPWDFSDGSIVQQRSLFRRCGLSKLVEAMKK